MDLLRVILRYHNYLIFWTTFVSIRILSKFIKVNLYI